MDELKWMSAKEAIEEAISLANLGALPEGPKGQLESIGLAQAYALISIARSLEEINKRYKALPVPPGDRDQYINQP